jgi:hypothetical protein
MYPAASIVNGATAPQPKKRHTAKPHSRVPQAMPLFRLPAQKTEEQSFLQAIQCFY